MNRFIPYEKLSKKEKRKRDREKRRDWGTLSPVTRKSKKLKIYNRKSEKKVIEEICRYDNQKDYW